MLDVRSERGQTLVQLALMIVVLLGFGALAIDMGYRYVERRRMQNAADAAALAGAYELCQGKPASVAIDRAKEYLTRNGVAAASIAPSDVTVTGGVVDVRARNPSPLTFLAGPAGFSTLAVGAEAGAVCGTAKSACGLWPIAFEESLYAPAPCGQRMIIWNSDNDTSAFTCILAGVNRPPCDCYRCSDSAGAFTLFTETSRGWLDFSDVYDPQYPDPYTSGQGCGAAELANRIRYDHGGRVVVPSCIPGISGVKAGVKDDVMARTGQTLSVPIYSGTCAGTTTGCATDGYQVNRFGCVRVVKWDQNFELLPTTAGAAAGYSKIKSKVIEVTKACSSACVTFCGGTDGSLPADWELRSVGLTK